MEAIDIVVRLNELSEKKLALIEEILLFTRSQNEVIKASRFEEVDALLGERQKRMDAVDKLDEQFIIFSTQLKTVLSIDSFESLPEYSLPGTVDLKDIVVRIQERLSQIKGIEDENSQLIKKELVDTKDKIDHSNAFKRLSGAYYPSNNEIPSYYFDKKK